MNYWIQKKSKKIINKRGYKMENYLKIDRDIKLEELKAPVEIIKNGGIVIFPTETVYGIGVNGLNEKAIRKLYQIKQRPLSQAISLLVSDMEMVNKIAKDITKLEYKLMERFFPGPLTIILKKKEIVPNIIAYQDTIGIRMPSGEIARKLVEYANVPIATPSANITGKPSGTNLQEIIKDFEGKVDYFIDGGQSKIGIASTIVKVIDNVPHILREGSITQEQIAEISGKIIKD